MSWQILTPESLLSRLSAPEHAALDRAAIDWQQDESLAAIAHEVAEEWRGGLRRVTTLDKRTVCIVSAHNIVRRIKVRIINIISKIIVNRLYEVVSVTMVECI
jgi:hypothetical protein